MHKNGEIIDKIVSDLENLGEISINDGSKELFIQAVDDKEGYSYVSSTNREFRNSREAADWVVERMNKYK
jgi:hypothetical protein